MRWEITFLAIRKICYFFLSCVFFQGAEGKEGEGIKLWTWKKYLAYLFIYLELSNTCEEGTRNISCWDTGLGEGRRDSSELSPCQAGPVPSARSCLSQPLGELRAQAEAAPPSGSVLPGLLCFTARVPLTTLDYFFSFILKKQRGQRWLSLAFGQHWCWLHHFPFYSRPGPKPSFQKSFFFFWRAVFAWRIFPPWDGKV